jgi:Peptidase M50B-like
MYDVLESFQAFMDEGSPADVALMLVVSAIGTVLVVAVHEGGHALAALLTGNRVHELRVGDSDDVILSAGSFRLRLGRLRGDGDVGGYVIYDGRSATPRQILAIALAGPAANVFGAALIAALSLRADGMLSVVLFLWTLASLATAIANLRPSGDPDTPAQWSDGRWAQAAWAARRTPVAQSPAGIDPNAATSVPPPSG